MERYLTKSRFKLGIECPAKLYYTNKKQEYADGSLDDTFLAALAEGGFQVSELAKFLFCDDPVKEDITITETRYEAGLQKTNERLGAGSPVVIAEASFRHENLFIRTDLLVKKNDCIEVYEVKAKAWDTDSSFWKTNKAGDTVIAKDWLPYLYDIAFQKHVLEKVFKDTPVNAFLILADKDVPATIEGLNQRFRIEKGKDRPQIKVVDGTTRSTLGAIPLEIIPVDEECKWIYNNPVQVDMEGAHSFEEVVSIFSSAYAKDMRIWSPIGSKCKSCQFKTTRTTDKLKNGFHECWKHWGNLKDKDFEEPLVLDLWAGKAGPKSLINAAIAIPKYFLAQLEREDYFPKSFKKNDAGMHPAERRELQILKARGKNSSFELDRKGLKKVFDDFEPPYHFIDFETSMVALPFQAGRRPYEAIAFQYSYHLLNGQGKIEHKNEFIHLDPGFPNYQFLRSLRNDLDGKGGTIFRYHSHENSYLRFIYKQLLEEKEGVVPDKDQLIDFIKEITHNDKKGEENWTGARDMVDLWELVLLYYYSPTAKGSNSIKDILPAVINDSNFIRDKYSKPIYGTGFIPSKNFKDHIWIKSEAGNNPYKTLPPVMHGYDNNQLDDFVPLIEEINDGGAAMMAYAYLQFSDIPQEQKEQIRKALLRYCELDTMAMVMIWEFWGNEVGFFK